MPLILGLALAFTPGGTAHAQNPTARDTSLAARLRPPRPDSATLEVIRRADASSPAPQPRADSLRNDLLHAFFDGQRVWDGAPARREGTVDTWSVDTTYIVWKNAPAAAVREWGARAKFIDNRSQLPSWGRVAMSVYELRGVSIDGDAARIDYTFNHAPAGVTLPTHQFYEESGSYYLVRTNGRWKVVWERGMSS